MICLIMLKLFLISGIVTSTSSITISMQLDDTRARILMNLSDFQDSVDSNKDMEARFGIGLTSAIGNEIFQKVFCGAMAFRCGR